VEKFLTEEHKKKISEALRGRYKTRETRKKLSIALKGKVFSRKHRENISKARKGKKNPILAEWNRQHAGEKHPKYGTTISDETKKKMSIALKGYPAWNKGKPFMRGENNPNWKGGIDSLNKRLRNWFQYRQWRDAIFARDNYSCQECGNSEGGNLNAHHIKPFTDIVEQNGIKTVKQALDCQEFWNIGNGITFCEECHRECHVL